MANFMQLLMQEAERAKRNLKAAPGRVADQVSNFKEDWKSKDLAKAVKQEQLKPEQFKAAIEEAAGNAIPGGAGVAGIFIGPKSKLWNAGRADQAKKALAAGMTEQDVNAILGVSKGADGQLRQEISDLGATVERITGTDRFNLVHPEFEKAYPGLLDSMDTSFTIKPGARQSGSYARRARKLEATGSNSQDLLQVILHEVQHAVQATEGFARGGSPNIFKLGSKYANPKAIDLLEAEQREAQKAIDKAVTHYNSLDESHPAKEIAKKQVTNKIASYNSITPLQLYKRLMGEVEARNTVNRQFMDTAERRRVLPENSEDVNRAKQLHYSYSGDAITKAK